MGQKAVMVLDGTPRMVVAICRSLRAWRIPTVHAFYGPRPLSLGSNAVLRDVPVSEGPDFFLSLKRALDDNDVDTLYACSDRALRALIPHYHLLRQRVLLSFPAPDILEQVLNKTTTLRHAQRCGIRVPKTFYLPSLAVLHAQRSNLTFPLIAKPRRAGSRSPFKTRRFDDFNGLVAAFEFENLGDDNIFQEFVPGSGIGISTIMHLGEPLTVFQHSRVHEWPATGGSAVLMKSEAVDPQLASASTRLLKEIRWQGPAMVEFRADPETGDVALMEINGRFVGSLPLALQAGVDFPYMLWQILHNHFPNMTVSYREGLKVRWTAGEVFRLRDLWLDGEARAQLHSNRFQALAQFLTSFAPPVRSALFDVHDMRPAFADVTSSMRGFIVAVAHAAVRGFVPGWLRRVHSQHMFLSASQRPTYRNLWWRHWAGLDRPSARTVAAAKNIMFVCRGNRIRSPLAAAFLRDQLNAKGQNYTIVSSGTQALLEEQIDLRALSYARRAGIPIADHPKRITSRMIAEADLIIVMDRIIQAQLLGDFPEARGKTFLLSEFSRRGAGQAEIDDPDTFAKPQFEQTISALQASVQRLSDFLETHAST